MILQGKDIVILNSSGTALVALSKSCEIDIKVETQEVSSPSTGTWKVYRTKRKGWSIKLSHLMMNLSGGLTVGDEVSVRFQVNPNSALSFNGMVNNVTIQQVGLTRTPEMIYYDQTRKKFVGLYQLNYYDTWVNGTAYMEPGDGDVFSYNNTTYYWHATGLSTAMLSGQAIVTQHRVSATMGNLAQGVFELLGSGPLQ